MHKWNIRRFAALMMGILIAAAFIGCGKQPTEDVVALETPPQETQATPTPTPEETPVATETDSATPTDAANPSPTVDPDGIPDPNETTVPKRTYEEWKKVNSEVIGWVKIADTQIDYPVVQGKDNEYYLSRGADKKSSKSGAVFMDYRNDEYTRRHLILYGHNMRNGTQFHDLNKFKDKAFFDKHPTFTFIFGDDEYSCEVFSAYVTTLDIAFTHVKFGSGQNFVKYMAELKKLSKYVNDIKIGEKDQVLTLVTCTYEYDNSRYVVHARMVKNKKK